MSVYKYSSYNVQKIIATLNSIKSSCELVEEVSNGGCSALSKYTTIIDKKVSNYCNNIGYLIEMLDTYDNDNFQFNACQTNVCDEAIGICQNFKNVWNDALGTSGCDYEISTDNFFAVQNVEQSGSSSSGGSQGFKETDTGTTTDTGESTDGTVDDTEDVEETDTGTTTDTGESTDGTVDDTEEVEETETDTTTDTGESTDGTVDDTEEFEETETGTTTDTGESIDGTVDDTEDVEETETGTTTDTGESIDGTVDDTEDVEETETDTTTHTGETIDGTVDTSTPTSTTTDSSSASIDFTDVNFKRYYDDKWYTEHINDTQSEQANIMYETLKAEGLNNAQIAGIMGNAFIESGFDNDNKTMDVNGHYSYGCFENNEAGRYSDFVKYCNTNGYSTTSTEAQTKYVVSIMKSDSTFMNVEDTEEGAKTAADQVRHIYENSGWAKSSRMESAAAVYSAIK